MRHDAAWMKRRGCRGMDPGPWFSTQLDEIAKARAVCNDCPVKSVCLSWQLEYEDELRQVDPGMFGGVTPAERREMLGLRPTGRGVKTRPGMTPSRVLEMLEADGNQKFAIDPARQGGCVNVVSRPPDSLLSFRTR